MRAMIATAATVLLLFLLLPSPDALKAQVSAGDSLAGALKQGKSSPFGFLLAYFPPLLIQRGIELKAFIRDTTFMRIRRSYGDRRAVDAVFCRSMQMMEDNTAMALLLAAIATIDHRTIGIKGSIFKLFFPLSDESNEEFAQRLAHLPGRIYADSPPGSAGDRDKLQHFFGSAFLSFVFESSGPSDRIGMSIETGEEMFVIGGTNDPRDVRTNRQGQRFGLALLTDDRRLPSEFLTSGGSRPPADTSRAGGEKDMRKEHP